MRLRMLQVLVTLAATALALIVLVAIGNTTRNWLQPQDQYCLAFEEIDCTENPFQEREEFLDEVQYLASMPDRLQLLDKALATQLAEAFARHPWVEHVLGVDILPPRQVHVRLAYRIPALAVSQPKRTCAVDAFSILLPASAPTSDLPCYRGLAIPPAGAAGTAWGDAGIEAAARIADYLRPQQKLLRLASIERQDGQWLLTTRGGSRIWWGQLPGNERGHEASAEEKSQRLRQYCQEHGGLDDPAGPYEYDISSRDGMICKKAHKRDR